MHLYRRFASRNSGRSYPCTGGDLEKGQMLDVMMLVIGVGAFGPFIRYVALCERFVRT
jgi:hypothetical protein